MTYIKASEKTELKLPSILEIKSITPNLLTLVNEYTNKFCILKRPTKIAIRYGAYPLLNQSQVLLSVWNKKYNLTLFLI